MSESRIRDFFSHNLPMIEPGLTLIEKEYNLPNSQGASGKVDILARDRFGHYVVIEIKKSNTTAREAIHELYKYIALLRTTAGFGFDKVRCILLSTHWHELTVPFSSFVRTVDYPVQGYVVELDLEGFPVSVKPAALTAESAVKKLCPIHMAFLSSEEKSFEKATLELNRIMSGIGVKDYCLLKIDYAGSSPMVIQPFAQYLVLDVVDLGTQLEIEGRTDIEFWALSEGERSNWGFEQLVQSHVASQFQEFFDSVEAGDPEKFTSMLSDWKVKRIYRNGRLAASKKLVSDGELIRDIAGFGGEHPYIYWGMTSPKFQRSWEEFVTKAEHSLINNRFWGEGIKWFLHKLQAEINGAAVSMYIYNPSNFILSLYFCMAAGNLSYLPMVEVVVEDTENQRVLVLTGILEWDRATFPTSPASIIGDIYGDVFGFVTSDLDSLQVEKQNMLMHRHGLSYGFVQTTIRERCPPVLEYLTNDTIDDWSLQKLHPEKLSSFGDFLEKNNDYLKSLYLLIQSNTFYSDFVPVET